MSWRCSILENICQIGFTDDIRILMTMLIYQICFDIEFWFICVSSTLRFTALNFSITWYQFFYPGRLSRATLLLYGLMIFKRFERPLVLQHVMGLHITNIISWKEIKHKITYIQDSFLLENTLPICMRGTSFFLLCQSNSFDDPLFTPKNILILSVLYLTLIYLYLIQVLKKYILF